MTSGVNQREAAISVTGKAGQAVRLALKALLYSEDVISRAERGILRIRMITSCRAKYFIHEPTKRCSSDCVEKLSNDLVGTQADLYSTQIVPALFTSGFRPAGQFDRF